MTLAGLSASICAADKGRGIPALSYCICTLLARGMDYHDESEKRDWAWAGVRLALAGIGHVRERAGVCAGLPWVFNMSSHWVRPFSIILE